ncbi:arsenate reductase (glutaredoxin) [Phenylobacterium immobile]|uniref:arsenate reductase (glutaredoxin) n=1 Tax=Phenylobacterium immobile TaxID=21 RepID=UPI000AF75397|nr:arsenate reductase (glutaredoxin) [Phenylobacterium immobile]
MSDPEFPIVIFHNPDCGTSRNVLEMILSVGYAPDVVEYLKAGWTEDQIIDLAARAGLSLRELLREKGTPAADLGLLDDAVDDRRLIEAMLAHPILVNRPIVVTPRGVGLCRPSETVFDLLDRKPATFTKEDGAVVRLE